MPVLDDKDWESQDDDSMLLASQVLRCGFIHKSSAEFSVSRLAKEVLLNDATEVEDFLLVVIPVMMQSSPFSDLFSDNFKYRFGFDRLIETALESQFS